MSTEDPFAAFKPSEMPIEKIPLEKKKHWKTAKAERDANKIHDKLAKQHQRSVHRTKPIGDDSIMVPIGAITACRHLTDDEIKFTIAMAGGISELSKSAQKHVVTALAKIFS